MKVQIKTALKSNFDKIRCMEQAQLVHPVGNNLCIVEIGRSQAQFISLDKQNSRLLDFIVSPNHRTIFTAEIVRGGVQICNYNLQGDRKNIRITDLHNYLPFDTIDSVQLLSDQFQSSVVFVIARTRNEACITLLDMFRLKIIAHGFISEFNDAVVCSQQTYEISICGKASVRRLKAIEGSWVVEEKLTKKLAALQVVLHQWLPLSRLLISTNTHIYITEDNDILQTINITTQQDPIRHLIKVSSGFIVFTEKLILKFYGQQGEDSLYIQKQKLKLNFGKVKISQVEINRRSDELYAVCTNGKFYRSTIEQMSASNKENYFNFEQFHLCYSSSVGGTLSTAVGQNYCLISTQNNIQLWDLERLCPTISMEANIIGEQRVIRISAINPDGHSLCVGYADRVRFYRILLNKFRQYGEYSIKNTSLIQYSHGGQLVALVYGKGSNSTLTVINTLSFKEILTFKLGFKPGQVIWNEHDDQVFASGEQAKILHIYQISTKTKKNIIHFDHMITYIRFDYLTAKLLVSTENQIYLIDSQQNKTVVKPKIDNLSFVFPIEGNYLATDKLGGLYCSPSIQFDKYSYISLFRQQKFQLLYRKGLLIAYSSASNIFVLKVKMINETEMIQTPENIILVEREEVNKFFDKVRLLQGQLEQLQSSTSVKLDQERRKYNESLQENERIFKYEIDFLQKKLADITGQKIKQQKNNAKIFDQLQTGQLKNVHDLEKVYDNKIRLQKQKYLALEQQCLEQKMMYEGMIKNLQDKYHVDIEKARQQYSQRLQKQIKAMQSEKQRHLEYKKKIETKIIDLEQEGETALYEMQTSKDNKIANLIEKHVKLEREYDSKMIALHNMEQDLNQLTEKYKQSLDSLKISEKTIQETMNKVAILENEIQKKNKTIEQKNTLIQQQSHQLDGLQKAKYVLSFRTTEVRKELEPKESLIQKLKSELFKLDDEYKKETKRNFQLTQRAEKLQMTSAIAKKEISDLKLQLKNKQRVHNDLCCEIFFIINDTDPKEWNNAFIEIYKTYVQQQNMKLKMKKKDDNTSEEINRHLIHVQQSLYQVATGNEKMLKGKEKEIIRKMKENAELVYDLNLMRKKQNEYMKEIKEKNTQISRLKRQIQQTSQGQKSSTRANTANTGATRKLISRDAANQNNSDWIDLSLKRQSEYLIPDSRRKGRVFSAHKTMVWRDESRKQKSRISDLARQLQSAKNTIMRQDRMIEQLNQRLLGLPQQNI